MMTYYPREPYGESAPLFTVGPGERVEGIDVKLLRGSLYSVKGKVTFNGKLVTTPMSISVTNPPPASGGSWGCLVRDGLFSMIDQSPGPHLMEVVGRTGGSSGNAPALVGRMTFDIVDSNVEVVFPLQQAMPIHGVLTAEGKDWQSQFSPGGAASTPPATPDSAGAAGSGTPPLVPHPTITLTGTDSDNARSTGRADETGAFILNPAIPGSYYVDVSGLPKGAYVKSVRYGSADTSQGVPVGLGGESLEIDISLKGATVTGSLQNEKGEPLSGYVVTAWPSNPNPLSSSHGVKSVSTNQQGSFQIVGLAPGKYYVASFEEIDSGLRQYTPFLARFQDTAATVDLTESAQSTVSLKPVSKEAADAEVTKLP
ncbi:MAG TPA: carboxypeptidase-like regulatory domain-containing protein, partial [Bryobacteraceae bacterium]|nr:carboxypeptidase-like regulatory domain-containing protein [Bryobacteraceae bacterium]